MEQSISCSKAMGNREIQVCKTLLNLKTLIRKFEILRNLKWGAKKPRSLRRTIPNKNYLLRDREEGESKRKGEVPSPNTPLEISDSESEERPRAKISKKRTKEEMLEMIEIFEQNREVMRKEVEKVKCYQSKLRAFNLKLKATKKQFPLCPVNPSENQDYLPSTSLHGISTTVDLGSNGSNKKLQS